MAKHVGARVYNSASISLTTATLTALTFDSERFDYDSIHSTVSNTGRLTCNTAGIYAIAGHASFAANATGERLLGIRLNGSTYIAFQQVTNAGGSRSTDLSVFCIYELAATDYVELIARQESGGDLNVSVGGNHSPEFEMLRIG